MAAPPSIAEPVKIECSHTQRRIGAGTRTTRPRAPFAEAKGTKEWCFGNGCLMQTTGWHECKKGELNACRRTAKEKPSF